MSLNEKRFFGVKWKRQAGGWRGGKRPRTCSEVTGRCEACGCGLISSRLRIRLVLLVYLLWTVSSVRLLWLIQVLNRRTKAITSRNGTLLWKDTCRWEDLACLSRVSNVAVLPRHTRFSSEAPGSLLVVPECRTSLPEWCDLPSRLCSALDTNRI